MENCLKVSEVFKGIQGEGRFAGTPMLFIRLSGCTRKCSFCDTKYHVKGKKVSLKNLALRVRRSNLWTVCITGGEPLLQRGEVHQLVRMVKAHDGFRQFHLETNGDLLNWIDFEVFDYIAISPKSLLTAKRVHKFRVGKRVVTSDVKVVTDLRKIGTKLILYASMLMPLTTNNRYIDNDLRQEVWGYCLRNGLRYSPRLHYEIWGPKRRK